VLESAAEVVAHRRGAERAREPVERRADTSRSPACSSFPASRGASRTDWLAVQATSDGLRIVLTDSAAWLSPSARSRFARSFRNVTKSSRSAA
jgi:hypothetical protein